MVRLPCSCCGTGSFDPARGPRPWWSARDAVARPPSSARPPGVSHRNPPTMRRKPPVSSPGPAFLLPRPRPVLPGSELSARRRRARAFRRGPCLPEHTPIPVPPPFSPSPDGSPPCRSAYQAHSRALITCAVGWSPLSRNLEIRDLACRLLAQHDPIHRALAQDDRPRLELPVPAAPYSRSGVGYGWNVPELEKPTGRKAEPADARSFPPRVKWA